MAVKMNDFIKWKYQCLAKDMVERLNEKKYDAHYADNFEEAKKIVLDMIPEGATIGLGGSMTIRQMGLVEEFRSEKYNLIDRYSTKSWEEEVEAYRKALLSDFFVSGTSCITKNGEIVNTDSSGNRVAALTFGPKRVIIIAGANKIVDDLDAAMKRLKYIAPMNCKRLNHKTPCAVTGICEDCQIQARMCNYTSIIHHGMKVEGRISVILVADEAGF